MKVLRSTEWEPVCFMANFEPMHTPVFIFKHKRWQGMMALNVAKFVDVAADFIYFLDANQGSVSASGYRNSVNIISHLVDDRNVNWTKVFDLVRLGNVDDNTRYEMTGSGNLY